MGLKENQNVGASVTGSDQGGVYLLTFHCGNQTVIPSTQGGPWNLSLLILSPRQGGYSNDNVMIAHTIEAADSDVESKDVLR